MTKPLGPGRPTFYAGGAMRSFHLKLTAEQRAYCLGRGGAAWVRGLIEEARQTPQKDKRQ